MSLYPVRSIQTCSNCKEHFLYVGNTLDVPVDVKCDACNNPFFKGYKYKQWFNTEKDQDE